MLTMKEILCLLYISVAHLLCECASPFSPRISVRGKNVVPAHASSKEFPFHLLVNQNDIKEALILAAINPKINGVLIAGGHGTGKSVIARAIHRLLPGTIDRVKESAYNIDPTGEGGVDSLLLQDLIHGKSMADLELEEIPLPIVQVPLGVM